MRYSKYIIPEPKDGNPLGEDMILLKDNSFMLIDGVGGSSDRTGHASTWKQCRDFLIKFKKQWKVQPHDTLEKMIHETLIKTANRYYHLQGTFVFVICRISNNLLEYAFIGDSSIFIIRNNQIILQTKPMYISKKNNMPFQIGYINKAIELYPIKTNLFRLEPNDKIIMCSDGVTDNLSFKQILRYSSSARTLTEKAKKVGIKNDDISAIIIEI